MPRCKGITNDGYRCKLKCSNEFCSIHNMDILCEMCNNHRSIKDRIKISECGHIFCNECFCKDFMKNQWIEGFSTENEIKCPSCTIKLQDISWQNVTSLLVDRNLLKRKILYRVYLCHERYVEFLKVNLKLNEEYSHIQVSYMCTLYNRIMKKWNPEFHITGNCNVDTVFFEKINPGDWRKRETDEKMVYIFYVGDPEMKKLFIQKELIEYVFHPSRINLEMLDN